MASARHTCTSPEWHTPIAFIESARTVMGTIDLDPASDAEADRTVKAARYIGAEEDGLVGRWSGCVFLNPPGGLVREFWRKAMDEWHAYHIKQLIWIGYSLEQLQTLQRCGTEKTPLDFPLCVPAKRIAFVESDARRTARVASRESTRAAASPSHANYIAYLGRAHHEFGRVFGQFGRVINVAA